MIHVVENGMTLCNWSWDYLSGKRKDKKVTVERADEATCSGCKKESRKRGIQKTTVSGGK